MSNSRILVDADACPVKDEVYKVAWRREVPVTVVPFARAPTAAWRVSEPTNAYPLDTGSAFAATEPRPSPVTAIAAAAPSAAHPVRVITGARSLVQAVRPEGTGTLERTSATMLSASAP